MKITYSERWLQSARRSVMNRAALLMALAIVAVSLVAYGPDGWRGVPSWVIVALLIIGFLSQVALYFRSPLAQSYEVTDAGIVDCRSSRATREERLLRWEDIWEVSVTPARDRAPDVVRLQTNTGKNPWIQARMLDDPSALDAFVVELEKRPRGRVRS